MELLIHKDKAYEYTYYLDKNGNEVFHGEYKDYHSNGQLWTHSFYNHGKLHGERKIYTISGLVGSYMFYIDGNRHPYVEMNARGKLLFQIKHPGFRFIEE